MFRLFSLIKFLKVWSPFILSLCTDTFAPEDYHFPLVILLAFNILALVYVVYIDFEAFPHIFVDVNSEPSNYKQSSVCFKAEGSSTVSDWPSVVFVKFALFCVHFLSFISRIFVIIVDCALENFIECYCTCNYEFSWFIF